MPVELPANIAASVTAALAEDLGSGDLTAALLPEDAQAVGQVLVRERAVLCGRAWFDEVFAQVDPAVGIHWTCIDGTEVAADTVLCTLRGPARAILTGERTALNFLQTLSGTATVAKTYTHAVAGTGCRLLDTRKTLPGLRAEQKYAVRCGGAWNHRHGLYDAVLIKENHIIAAGGIEPALSAAHAQAGGALVEIEVETLAECELALAAGATRLLLDNFTLEELEFAVAMNAEQGGNAELEASGNVTLDTLPAIAATGVDYISIGALTKHLRAIDLSLRFSLQ